MKRLLHMSLAAAAAAVSCPLAMAQENYARCGDLPPAVVEMRDRILKTAETGGIEDLAALGDAGVFTASYGGSGTTEFWRQLAAEGTDVREVARTLLALGCIVAPSDDTIFYTWPSAVDAPYADLAEAERSALAELHGADLKTLYVEGPEVGYYVGWSLTIAGNGDWIALVAGD